MNQEASYLATRRALQGAVQNGSVCRKKGGTRELLTNAKDYFGARTSFLSEMERACDRLP